MEEEKNRLQRVVVASPITMLSPLSVPVATTNNNIKNDNDDGGGGNHERKDHTNMDFELELYSVFQFQINIK